MVHTRTDQEKDKDQNYGLSDKLGFFLWGVRYFDIILVSSYPCYGAVLALPDLTASTLLRLLVFVLINTLYIAHIFLYNDWCDARINPEEPRLRHRHAFKKPVFSNKEIMEINAALIIVSLAFYAILSLRLFALVVMIEIITYLYSQIRVNLKGIPLVSLFIHFGGSFLYVLGGWVVFENFTAPGFFIASFIGIVQVAGHFANEIDDFEQDLAVGIRTNAVAFGQRKSLRTGLATFLLSSIWFVAGSILWLSHPAYTVLGALLVLIWVVQSWRYRHWRGGGPIKEFRRFYRVVYALFTLALFSIKLFELLYGAN